MVECLTRDRRAAESNLIGVIYPSLVLVQPRKTRPCLTERLLMGRKESNQTNFSTKYGIFFFVNQVVVFVLDLNFKMPTLVDILKFITKTEFMCIIIHSLQTSLTVYDTLNVHLHDSHSNVIKDYYMWFWFETLIINIRP